MNNAKLEQLTKEAASTVFTRVGYNGEPDGKFDVAPMLNFLQEWSTPEETAAHLDDAIDKLLQLMLSEDAMVQPGKHEYALLSTLRQLRNCLLKGTSNLDLGLW